MAEVDQVVVSNDWEFSGVKEKMNLELEFFQRTVIIMSNSSFEF